MDKLLKLSQKLNQSSQRLYNNPYTSIDWEPSISDKLLCYSPELISLYHCEQYKSLSQEQINKLSFYEAVNFFSLNINGEKDLISGLSTRLYKKYPKKITDYIHHFLDEENKHMLWFGNFCMKYANKVYQDKKIVFPREYKPGEEEFLFFAKVVIFEEIVDYHNVFMSKDENLPQLIRKIHNQHHIDESRHLSFGREISNYLFNLHKEKDWDETTISNIQQYLENYMVATWREYYNPEVYTDAGLENSYELMEQAWEHPKSREHRVKISEKCINFFLKNEMMKNKPKL